MSVVSPVARAISCPCHLLHALSLTPPITCAAYCTTHCPRCLSCHCCLGCVLHHSSPMPCVVPPIPHAVSHCLLPGLCATPLITCVMSHAVTLLRALRPDVGGWVTL